MKKKWLLPVAGMLMFTTQAWCALEVGTVYKMVDDYNAYTNNPSGTWSFMYVAATDTTFNTANYTLFNEKYDGGSDSKWWRNTGDNSAYLGRHRALASTTNDVVLVWTASDSGYVDFDGSAIYGQTPVAPNNGTMKVYINVPGQEQLVYTIQGRAVDYQKAITWHISQIQVNAGDTITVRFSADGGSSYDGIYWRNADNEWNYPRITVVSPVPEPAGFAAISLGVGALLAIHRRK